MLRRTGRSAVLLLAAASVLVLVVASPLALEGLGSLHRLNWVQLSYIGQTYGAASALLAGLALVGVVGSIVLQTRAINAGLAQDSRQHHAHLVEMALTDPVYQRAWGRDPASFAPDSYRQRVYLNLIFSYWQRDYRINGIQEGELRSYLVQVFRGEAARLWWDDTGQSRRASAKNRRDKRFCLVVDEEFQKAISSGPPVVLALEWTSPNRAEDRLATGSLLKVGVVVMTGAIGGVVFRCICRKAALRYE
jgi:Family of unknown function (DUF6082)